MDERRFRTALEAVHSYGEDEIFAALGVIAERFGWTLEKRDPGPDCCEYGSYYADRGVMFLIHECPQSAPSKDEELLMRAFNLPTINATGRIF